MFQIDQEILFDFSKNIVTEQTIDLLVKLAEQSKLADKIAAMFDGDKINFTEQRAVLHTALRNKSGNKRCFFCIMTIVLNRLSTITRRIVDKFSLLKIFSFLCRPQSVG